MTKLAGNRRRPYAVRKIVGWTEKGTPQYKYISYHKTQREAEKALDKYTDDPYTLGKSTLEDVYKEWYALKEQEKTENTLRGYRTRWKHLEPLYDVKIQSLDRFELQKYFDSLELTENAMTRVKEMIKMLFEYAVKRGILPISALNLYKAIDIRPKVESKEYAHCAITREEIDDLWNTHLIQHIKHKDGKHRAKNMEKNLQHFFRALSTKDTAHNKDDKKADKRIKQDSIIVHKEILHVSAVR